MLAVKFKLIGRKGVLDSTSLAMPSQIQHEENQEIACEIATKS
jgi:hypothetical protein